MGVSGSKPHPIESKYFVDFAAQLPSLEGKTVVITGCTTGTGYIVARTSIERAASVVILLNRPSERSEAAQASLAAVVPTGSRTVVETIPCDLQNFGSVTAAAEAIAAKYDAIDVLCNNAGVMALGDEPTGDGYDVQMQTNHLSHFLLTKKLYPLLKKAAELRGEARVVNHSSAARHGKEKVVAKNYEKNGTGNLGGNGASMLMGGGRWKRYHQTKLANAVFTAALRDRFDAAECGVVAAVAAPGLAATNLQVTSNQEGGMGSAMCIMKMAQSAEDGTMPILAACFDPTTKNGDFWEPANMGNMKGPAVKVSWDKLSSDEKSRKLLWEKSEEVCGEFKIE